MDDCLCIRLVVRKKRDERTPLRQADCAILIRAQQDSDGGPAKRAEAVSKCLEEFFQTAQTETLTMQTMPSGRVILSVTGFVGRPGSLDASGRQETLVEFTVEYRDGLTQN